jgi:hypothetical protein
MCMLVGEEAVGEMWKHWDAQKDTETKRVPSA